MSLFVTQCQTDSVNLFIRHRVYTGGKSTSVQVISVRVEAEVAPGTKHDMKLYRGRSGKASRILTATALSLSRFTDWLISELSIPLSKESDTVQTVSPCGPQIVGRKLMTGPSPTSHALIDGISFDQPIMCVSSQFSLAIRVLQSAGDTAPLILRPQQRSSLSSALSHRAVRSLDDTRI
jgi:hypothetical protein